MEIVWTQWRELTPQSLLLRLMLAMMIGGVIGLERGRKRRPAGFRTYMLVCVGAALTMILGQYQSVLQDTLNAAQGMAAGFRTDMTRFSAQVINGIGFLGAGTIIMTGRRQIKGLTTAACLWTSACMGLAVGAGFYECVAIGLVLVFLCVRVLPAVESFLMENARNMCIYIELKSLKDVREIIEFLKSRNFHIYAVEVDPGSRDATRNPSGTFHIRLKERQHHSQILADIAEACDIRVIDEI